MRKPLLVALAAAVLAAVPAYAAAGPLLTAKVVQTSVWSNGYGANSADSWVDVKGIDYVIENNTGSFSSPGTFAKGYETHNPGTTPSFPNGCGNVWRSNSSNLGGVGAYAIRVTSTSACPGRLNVVYASNTVTNAVSGLTNIPVTP